MDREQRDINVITLGETGVGKTSIIQRLKDDSFNENQQSTFHLSFFTLQRPFDKLKLTINLNFRDTVGQERLVDKLPMQYIRDSHVVLLVFSTIENLEVIKQRWYKFYKENSNIDGSRFILIGNKSDEFGDERDEIKKQGDKFAEEIDALFLTCSAKSRDNMDNVERYIITEAKRYIEKEEKEKKKKEGMKKQQLNSSQSFKVKNNKKNEAKNERKCC